MANEIRGTGKENEILGGAEESNLSFIGSLSEYSYWSDGGVYELLGMSSE